MYNPDILGVVLNFIYPLFPFILGLIRWKKMDPIFHPFILLLGCAFLAELFRCFQLINYYNKLGLGLGTSLIGYNLYVLAISILFIIFFYNLGQMRNPRFVFFSILGLFCIVWILDHFILSGNKIHTNTRVFRVFYSFFLCILSIQHINKLLVQERGNLIKNSSFLICVGILVFFLPYIITEGIFLFMDKNSVPFIESIFEWRKYSIILLYLIYTFAVVWIPQKKPFIQLS